MGFSLSTPIMRVVPSHLKEAIARSLDQSRGDAPLAEIWVRSEHVDPAVKSSSHLLVLWVVTVAARSHHLSVRHRQVADVKANACALETVLPARSGQLACFPNDHERRG